MKSLNQDRLIKRMFALLGTTGLAAFSGLPVLAQVNTNSTLNNGVLNSNPSILNEYPYNQGSSSTQSQGAVDCSAYVNGGIGGPIDNGSRADNSSSSQSSYDTATIPQNQSPNSMSQSSSMNPPSYSSAMKADSQFSAQNPNATVPFRDNGLAGTAGGESNLNLQTNGASSGSSMMGQSSNRNAMMSPDGSSNSMNQSSYSHGMRFDGQFSSSNPNAAIPFRDNGPAGTAGGESNLNLQASMADKESSMQSAMSSVNMTSSAYSAPVQANSAAQAAAPIPVECLPGGVNNR